MKIRGEVIAVETLGDRLRVTLQGKAARESVHNDFGRHEFQVPATKQNGEVYHVGRIVHVDLSPHA